MTRSLAIACLLPLVGVVHAQSTPASQALAARIKAMAEIPSTFGAVYSPDGKRIAFLSNRTGTPQVWLVSAAGGEPKQITQERGPDRLARVVAGRGHVSRTTSRAAAATTRRSSSASPTAPSPSASRAAGRKTTSAGDFAPDGRYWFRSNQRNPKRPIPGSTIPRPARRRSRSSTTTSAASIDIERPSQPRADLAPGDARQRQPVSARPRVGQGAPAHAARGPRDRLRRARTGRQCGLHRNNLGRDRLVVSRDRDRCGGQSRRDDAARRTRRRRSRCVRAVRRRQRAVLSWNVGGRTELELVRLPSGKRTPLPAAAGRAGRRSATSRRTATASR